MTTAPATRGTKSALGQLERRGGGGAESVRAGIRTSSGGGRHGLALRHLPWGWQWSTAGLREEQERKDGRAAERRGFDEQLRRRHRGPGRAAGGGRRRGGGQSLGAREGAGVQVGLWA